MATAEPLFDDLYREVILEHYRRPRNRGRLEVATSSAEGMNPVCGDEVALDLRMEAGKLVALGFEGQAAPSALRARRC